MVMRTGQKTNVLLCSNHLGQDAAFFLNDWDMFTPVSADIVYRLAATS